MLAHDYNQVRDGNLSPIILMPKLNGVRARFIPGMGFISRDQKLWPPDKFTHITPPAGYEYDGELYVHEWPLQRINSAVAINSSEVSDDTRAIQYHIYDLPGLTNGALQRMQIISKIDFTNTGCVPIEWYNAEGTCHDKKSARFKVFVVVGYEGMMLKQGIYENTRSFNLLKWKAWRDDWFKFSRVEEGEGKRKGMAGKLVLTTRTGLVFKCGTGWSDDLASYWWQWRHDRKRMPTRVKIQYINYSTGGSPLNSSFLEAEYGNI